MNEPRTVNASRSSAGQADAAPATTSSGSRPGHDRAGRPAGRPPPPGSRSHRPALVPAWLLRHLRDAGQRREVLACVTRLDGLGDLVVVEPLASAPVVGDLVVDMEPLYRRLEPAGRPLVRASERRPGRIRGGGSSWSWNAEDCLECGLCLSACPVAGDPRFLGPVAPARPSGSRRSRVAPTRGRCWAGRRRPRGCRCHAAFECSAVCRPGSTRARSCACAAGCSGPAAPAGGRYHREERT